LRQMMVACRKGGTLDHVYGGFVDKMPFGAAFNKGLTFRMGHARSEVYEHVAGASLERETRSILRCIYTLPLEQAPQGYEIFSKKKDNCIKVVLKP